MTDSTDNSPRPEGEFQVGEPSWYQKFAVAGRGLRVAISEEKSFIGHFGVAAGVIIAGLLLGITKLEWCVVVLCMMAGLSTELLNTAVERLAKVITREYHPEIRNALDIASGAVLIITIGASTLGVLVIGGALWRVFFS